MEIRDLKAWLNLFNDDDEIEFWVKVGNNELSNPNMATVPKDEIFEWQDQLDDIDMKEGMAELFHLIDDILDELENRLQLDPEFIKEMEEIHGKVDAGDLSDFVKVDLPSMSLWDYVNNYCEAKKIKEYVESAESLINYIQNRIKADVYIEGSSLYIKSKNLSTSIIASLLDIEATDIDDRKWEQGTYRIILKRR